MAANFPYYFNNVFNVGPDIYWKNAFDNKPKFKPEVKPYKPPGHNQLLLTDGEPGESELLTEPDPDKFMFYISQLIEESEYRIEQVQCIAVQKHYIHKETKGTGNIGIKLKPGSVGLFGFDSKTKTVIVAHLKTVHYNIQRLELDKLKQYVVHAFELLLPNADSNCCINHTYINKQHIELVDYSFEEAYVMINCETGKIFQHDSVNFVNICDQFDESDSDCDIEPGLIVDGKLNNKPYFQRSFSGLYPDFYLEGGSVGMVKTMPIQPTDRHAYRHGRQPYRPADRPYYEPYKPMAKKVTEKDLGISKHKKDKKDKWFYGKR